MNRFFAFFLAAFTATSTAIFFYPSIPAHSEEAIGIVRGRIVDESAQPIVGIKVSTFLNEKTISDSFTDKNGCFTLQSYIGRKSLKFKASLNLFGLTTKTQTKTDIRVGEIDIFIDSDTPRQTKLTVPVFLANLERYSVYLCDVELNGGTARWLEPDYFKLAPLILSADIVREGQELRIEVPVELPPYSELAGSMRVVIHGELFKDSVIKAFDDGKNADKARGDGIYTASHIVSKKGPFGFFVLKGVVELPPLSALFEPGKAWPLMKTVIDTAEAGGHVERLTTIYSIGGVETGLSAEWYYFDNNDDSDWTNALKSMEKSGVEEHWYSLYARSKLADATSAVFVCRGMVEFRAASALRRMIGYYESGDYENAQLKLNEARKLAPDYESLPLWDARLMHAHGNINGAIEALEDAVKAKKLKGLSIVLAELYRENNMPSEAFAQYIEAFNETFDPYILLTVADYLYEMKEYEAAQRAYNLLKYYAESVPYNYGFLMYGGYDFSRRFFNTSKTAEQWLFKEYAPPSNVWTKELFEDAYIMGSVSGWKARLGEDDWTRLTSDTLKKYSVMLRLAGDIRQASDVSLFIDGDVGMIEQGIVELESAFNQSYEWSELNTINNPHLQMALKRFISVAAKDSENFDSHYLSALALFIVGNYEEALEYALKAIELQPNHQELRFLTARIFETLEQYEDSVPHWQWFVDEAPDGAAKIIAGERLLDLKAALGIGE